MLAVNEIRLSWEGVALETDMEPEDDSPRFRPLTAAIHARFRRLVQPHIADGFRLARWLTGDTTDAEDVMQEASLRAYRAVEAFTESNPRAWFLTIVRNTAYSWLARHRPKALLFAEDVEFADRAAGCAPDPAQPSPEATLMAKEDAGRLARAIDAMPLPIRETLVLREQHGLTYREIAQVCEVPVGTVMSRLARSRQRLIAVLEGGER